MDVEKIASLRLIQVGIGGLANVSLTIAPGEVVCLSGPSGAGKTRLLRAIADLEVHAGEVWLGEQEQRTVSGHAWRRQVMLVPTESQWWADTVAPHFPQVVAEGLDALGLSTSALEWPVNRLSSGEKQRLALLRALSHDPRALLLDEPTANLDSATARRVEEWLLGIIRDRHLPVLWVAHKPEQIQRVAHRHFRIQGAGLEQVPCT